MMTRWEKENQQLKLEMVMSDQLVYIDFSFIYDLVEPFYDDKGRASIDPVVLFEMTLIQALDGIRSEEKLVDAIFDALELALKYAGADAGYFNLDVLEELSSRNLTPVIGPRKYSGKKGKNQSTDLNTILKKMNTPVLKDISFHTKQRRGKDM